MISNILDAIAKIVADTPVWTRVVVVLSLLVLLSVVVVVTVVQPGKVHAQSEAQFRDEYRTISATLWQKDDPAQVRTIIDSLFTDAPSDRDRCLTGNLYLEVAGRLRNPQMPQNLQDFIEDGTTRHIDCVVRLEKRALAILQQQTVAASNAGSSSHAPAAAQPQVVAAESNKTTKAAAQILQAATQTGRTGWMYIGEKAVDSDLLSDSRTIVENTQPTAGSRVVTTTNVNLRQTDDPRKALGSIAGVAAKGSTVEIVGHPVGIDHIVNGTKVGYYVWAPVQLSEKGTTTAEVSPLPTASTTASPLPSASAMPTPSAVPSPSVAPSAIARP
jgi:hypothetical protein